MKIEKLKKILNLIIERGIVKNIDILAFTFCILIFLLIFSVASYYFLGKIVHSKKEVIVPNIVGKSVLEALDIVSKAGLGLKKIGEVYNPNYPSATIVVQQPSAGMVVRKGRFVNVILSLGGEKVFVPSLIGEELRKAEVLLRQYNLLLGTVTYRYSLRYDKNVVIFQNPPPSEIVEKNSYVDLQISLGFPPPGLVLMPDFVNKTLENVYDWAARHNVELVVNEKFTEDITENLVLQQNIPPDTEITSSTMTLEIVVSKRKIAKGKEFEKENYNFEYELPFVGEGLKNVKIVQISDEGEYVLYNKPTSSKQKITLYVPPRKNSKLRIFVDGVLIDEK